MESIAIIRYCMRILKKSVRLNTVPICTIWKKKIFFKLLLHLFDHEQAEQASFSVKYFPHQYLCGKSICFQCKNKIFCGIITKRSVALWKNLLSMHKYFVKSKYSVIYWWKYWFHNFSQKVLWFLDLTKVHKKRHKCTKMASEFN